MNIIKKILNSFKKEEKNIIGNSHEREARELLRENLNLISVDVFHYDDPLNKLQGPDRREYLRYFHMLNRQPLFQERLKFHINKQANLTLKNSKDGELDTAGVMKMDGMGTIKDDVERLSVMFAKEEAEEGHKLSQEVLRGL